VLYGCERTFNIGYSTMSTGAVFYNGEVFLHSGSSVPTPGFGEVVVTNLITSQYTTNADPVTFSDGHSHSVHNIRTVSFAAGVSGHGSLTVTTASDYSNLIQYSNQLSALLGIPAINSSISSINSSVSTLNNEIAVGSWQTPTFPVASGGAFQWGAASGHTARYRVNGMGNVEVQGLITNNMSGDGSMYVINFPSGARPSQDQRIPCSLIDNSGTEHIYTMVISASTGNMTFYQGSSIGIGGTEYLSLDTIRFSTT
jgi:hypothetical protein